MGRRRNQRLPCPRQAADGISSAVQAVIDISGPTDISRAEGHIYDVHGVYERLVGGPVAERSALVQLANPIAHARQGNVPPFLIVHAEDDEAVPFHQAVILYEALRELGAEAELLSFSDGGHGLDPYWGGGSYAVDREMLAFFGRHLCG